MKVYTLKNPDSEFAMSFFDSADSDEIDLILHKGITEEELRRLYEEWGITEEPFCEWLKNKFIEV